MLKKIIIGGLALTLVAGIVLGRNAKSYIRTMGKRAQEAVQSEMDLDFEIDRARTLIEDLQPAIQDCKKVVMKQQLELARMEVSVGKQEGLLDESKEQILALRDDLSSGKDKFRYASMTFTRNDVERDLTIRMDRFKAAESALNRDKKIMIAQRDKLRANQQTLESMEGQKKELEVAIAQLEARFEQLQAEEAISTLSIDDSQLSMARKLIEDLNTEMEVRASVLDQEGTYRTGLIPVGQPNEKEHRDIASEVDSYFGGSNDTVEAEVLDPAA